MTFAKTPIALAALAMSSALPVAAQSTSTTIEAESMALSSYKVEGKRIMLTASSGTASKTFSGASGTYNMQVYVVPENDGRPTLEVYKGATQLQRYTYPLSNTATSFTISNVALSSGETIKLVGRADAGAWARVDKIVLTPLATSTQAPAPSTAPASSYSGTPYSGSPVALPRAFEAANFDKGGQGVAYRDLTTGNAGSLYRTAEDVDIVASSDSQGGPYAVNSFQTGEWLAYTVNVPASGNYDLAIRASNNQTSPAAFHIEVDGVNVTGSVSVPRTGSWTTYQWFGKQDVSLTAGKHVLKVVSDQQYFNLNAVSVLAGSVSAPAAATTPSAPATTTPTTNPAPTRPIIGDALGSVSAVPMTIEAESMALSSYKVEGNRIMLTASSGTASKTFGGASGTYNMQVHVVPENDGRPTLEVYKGATQLQRYTYPLSNTATSFTISNVALSSGETIKLVGRADAGAWARVDKIVLTPLATSTQAPAASAPLPGTVQFSCSFENSATDCGFREQAKVSGRATVVEVARDGRKGVRLNTQPGDDNVSGSGTRERNDLALGQEASDCYPGREQWWAHSVLFPSDFVVPSGGGLAMDFHHTGSTGQANFNLQTMSTGLHMQIAGGNTVATGSTSPGVFKTASLGPIVKNVWYDFVYHVKWSSGSDGFMYAWLNGKLQMAHRGATLYEGQGCYLKLANYHAAHGEASSIIHDRVMRGTSADAVSLTPLQAVPPDVLAAGRAK